MLRATSVVRLCSTPSCGGRWHAFVLCARCLPLRTLEKHTESTDNTCNGTKLEAPKELDNVVYQYVLRQNHDGQELCLNGRFGETCLRPEKR